MHTFTTLYSRTSTGAVQQWTITVDGNKFFSASGQVGGAITTTKPTVCKSKNVGRANETTPEQQAEKEAQARYDKQLKSGYFEDVNRIDDFCFVQPMLAKKYLERQEKGKVSFPVGVQLKFNGGRCVITRHGAFTRTGEVYHSIPHIVNSLEMFFVQWPYAVLDGELYAANCGQKLNEVMKLIRKSVNITPDDKAKSEKYVRFYVYDGYGYDGITEADFYRKRAAAVKKNLSSNPYYCHVHTIVAHTHEKVMEIYQRFIDQGEEGAIVRLLEEPYENKRSSVLLKVKPTDDDEFLILDIEEGVGNRSGMAGKVHLKFHDGRVFKANVKGEEAQFVELLKNKADYIGKKATIYYNGFTGLGLPNYAQFDCNSSMGGAADKTGDDDDEGEEND